MHDDTVKEHFAPDIQVKPYHLLHLNLSYNRLMFLHPDAFLPISKLHVLDLSHNLIPQIDLDTFYHLKSLTSLNLSNNNLMFIQEQAFASLLSVTTLILSHNPLKSLHMDIFNGMHALQKIHLVNLEFSDFNGDIISWNSNLQFIDISQNKIHFISNYTVAVLSRLKHLLGFNISQNPLNCSCAIYSFKLWIKSEPSIFDKTVPTCQSPSSLQGLPMDQLSHKMLCTHSSNKQVTKKPKKENKPWNYNKPTKGPIVYDPMLGWKIAGTLSSMLALFLLLCLLDKLKRMFFKYRKRKRLERELEMWRRLKSGFESRDECQGLDEAMTLINGSAGYRQLNHRERITILARRYSHSVPLESYNLKESVNIGGAAGIHVQDSITNYTEQPYKMEMSGTTDIPGINQHTDAPGTTQLCCENDNHYLYETTPV